MQAKLFLWGRCWQLVPYAYAPGGWEVDDGWERGGGVLAEYDLSGKGKTVVGVNLLRGSDRLARRSIAGVYARLGFGQWGILAEHNQTRRGVKLGVDRVRFGQQATYAQVFYAFREWLVGSAVVERLAIGVPHREHLLAGRGELAARLNPNWTIGLQAGMQHNRLTGKAGPAVTVQLAWKMADRRPW